MDYAIPSITEHTVDYKTRFWVENSHYTDYWHLILVENGSFSYSMLEQTDVAGPYSAVLFPLHVAFNRNVLQEIKFHYFSLVFNKDDDWLKENRQFLYGKLPISEQLVKEACEFCGNYYGNEYLPLKDNVIKSLWSHALAPYLQTDATIDRVITNTFAADAVAYMHNHIREKISIEALSKHLGFTHIQFTRLFSKEMGKPPVVYLTELRVNKAKRLLTETNMSIADIAKECGFENQFYLHNRFKKTFGMSPSVYRKHTRI